MPGINVNNLRNVSKFSAEMGCCRIRRGYTSSPHQYNCTYYSALHGNPRHYLMARAIQFFTPGLPMVYYVGLLAGRNDHEVLPLRRVPCPAWRACPRQLC